MDWGDGLKIPKLEKFDRVEIDWVDAFSKGGWQCLDDVSIKELPSGMTSVGLFLELGDDYIAYCDSANHAKQPNRMVNNIMKIPLVMVKKIIKFKR